MYRFVVAALASAVIAGSAQAATVTFDLGGQDVRSESSFSYSSDGLDLAVTGQDRSCGLFVGCYGGVSRTDDGLGVASSILDDWKLEDAEYLTFSFSEDVTFTSISFSSTTGDRARLNGVDERLTLADGIASYTFSSGVLGDTLEVAGSPASIFWPWFGEPGSSFYVSSITIDTIAPVEVAPVPLPAAGFMLIAGLGGLAAVRGRRKA